jgi:hypothetical protein
MGRKAPNYSVVLLYTAAEYPHSGCPEGVFLLPQIFPTTLHTMYSVPRVITVHRPLFFVVRASCDLAGQARLCKPVFEESDCFRIGLMASR